MCCPAVTSLESHVTSPGAVLVQVVVVFVPSALEEIASVLSTLSATGYSLRSPPHAVATNKTITHVNAILIFFMSVARDYSSSDSSTRFRT